MQIQEVFGSDAGDISPVEDMPFLEVKSDVTCRILPLCCARAAEYGGLICDRELSSITSPRAPSHVLRKVG